MDEKLERRLDLLCLDMLEMVSDIDEKKQQQEKHLQDGFLCLAKARYSMGVDRVSKLQYASEMSATMFVDCSEEKLQEKPIHKFTCVESNLFDNREEESENKPSSEPALRKRHQKSSPREADDDGLNKSMNDMKINAKKSISKPIKWFSPLPPQSLRQAQDSFIKAARVSCEICTLSSKFDQQRALYREARRQQASLKNAERETPDDQKDES